MFDSLLQRLQSDWHQNRTYGCTARPEVSAGRYWLMSKYYCDTGLYMSHPCTGEVLLIPCHAAECSRMCMAGLRLRSCLRLVYFTAYMSSEHTPSSQDQIQTLNADHLRSDQHTVCQCQLRMYMSASQRQKQIACVGHILPQAASLLYVCLPLHIPLPFALPWTPPRIVRASEMQSRQLQGNFHIDRHRVLGFQTPL